MRYAQGGHHDYSFCNGPYVFCRVFFKNEETLLSEGSHQVQS